MSSNQVISNVVNPLSYQAVQNLINDDQFIADNEDRINLDAYNATCHNWLTQNSQNRDTGRPVDSNTKPKQPQKTHISSTVNPSDSSSVTITFTSGPELLGTPCPDLPSATLPAGNFKLGAQVTRISEGNTPGAEFASGLSDNIPYNTRITDPSTGYTYLKMPWGPFASVASDGSCAGLYLRLS